MIYGMRGGIEAAQMEAIHAGLPYSLELRTLNPCLENPLASLGGQTSEYSRIHALVRLSHGWHLLNEVRTALIEAEACKLFYENVEPSPMEAAYRCRFYLDDAILRLYPSCEHLLRSIIFYWGLTLPTVRRPLLAKVIAAAENSTIPDLSGTVAASLQSLAEEWQTCKKYRDDWVHNERPALQGIDFEVSFDNLNEGDIPEPISTALGLPTGVSGRKMVVAMGIPITELHQAVKSAYCQLFGVYERLVPLIT
jgi:hypothetical protein